MCGIAGFIEYADVGGTGREAIARAMARSLAHRGPDDEGVWTNDREGNDVGVALAHRRLSVIDPTAAGAQPMMSRSGRFVISYNGELYNAPELASELSRSGTTFRGGSDTEILLEACSAWGLEAALKKANGMFAFALWDREKRTLSLARDRLGIKPLFWGRYGETFIFASELKAFKAHPAFKARIDRSSLTAYMRFGYVPSPRSIYRDTHKLEPGHWLTIERTGAMTKNAYWDMRAIAAGDKQYREDTGEQLDRLESLLQDAVGRQMVSDVPLGCFLSGGIDSSLVTALMQSNSSVPVKTFSIGFHDQGYNEAEDAKRIAHHLGADHTELYVDPEMALATIPKLPVWYDEPFGDPSQIPTRLVSELARRDVTVALSGDGGDEGFGGYNRYLWGEKIRRLLSATPGLLRPLVGSSLRAAPPRFWEGLNHLIPRTMRPANFPQKVRKLARLFAGDGPEALYLNLVSQWDDPEAVVLGGKEPEGPLNDKMLKESFADDVERMQYLDTVTYLPDDILTKVDRASMSVSLEVRVPLLDHRVLEAAWSLPPAMKVNGGEGKWALKEILARHVPRDLFERPKQGFGVPLERWLRGSLREWAGDLLGHDRLVREGYFDAELVGRVWSQHQAGTHSHAYALWTVLMFQSWLEEEAKS